MTAAHPLPIEVEADTVEAARGRIRAVGLDPAAVPHAGAQQLDGLRHEVRELMALGLEGDALVTVLAGPPVPDPAELTALLGELCATTR